jgi:hypothetical protein
MSRSSFRDTTLVITSYLVFKERICEKIEVSRSRCCRQPQFIFFRDFFELRSSQVLKSRVAHPVGNLA